MATLADPLFALCRKGVKWSWGEAEQTAFDAIKKSLLEDACLHLIQANKPFRIPCDACDLAVGGVLEQQTAAGEWRPCSLHSPKLTETQVRWDVREKEAYAIIRALTKWQQYIGTSPVDVLSDHRTLELVQGGC